MHDIIVRLLRSPSDEKSIECFCKLIITTGRNLDHEMGKVCKHVYLYVIELVIGYHTPMTQVLISTNMMFKAAPALNIM